MLSFGLYVSLPVLISHPGAETQSSGDHLELSITGAYYNVPWNGDRLGIGRVVTSKLLPNPCKQWSKTA